MKQRGPFRRHTSIVQSLLSCLNHDDHHHRRRSSSLLESEHDRLRLLQFFLVLFEHQFALKTGFTFLSNFDLQIM